MDRWQTHLQIMDVDILTSVDRTRKQQHTATNDVKRAAGPPTARARVCWQRDHQPSGRGRATIFSHGWGRARRLGCCKVGVARPLGCCLEEARRWSRQTTWLRVWFAYVHNSRTSSQCSAMIAVVLVGLRPGWWPHRRPGRLSRPAGELHMQHGTPRSTLAIGLLRQRRIHEMVKLCRLIKSTAATRAAAARLTENPARWGNGTLSSWLKVVALLSSKAFL